MRRTILMLVLGGCGGSPGAPDARPDFILGEGPQLAGCPVFPQDHVFNTPIDALPVDANSDAYIATIGGDRLLHLDLGTQTDQHAADFYGIPYNLVAGSTLELASVYYTSDDPDLSWDAAAESDCVDGGGAVQSPCESGHPRLPFPDDAIVEGGLSTATDHQPYGDHHLLVVDTDACRLWEAYHVYRPLRMDTPRWEIFGSATFRLDSTALRKEGWTSADAAGFPILPLLLRADEADAGEIRHALRFTINSNKIRNSYVWPARHFTTNGTDSTSLPPMGQLFRLKADFEIPATHTTQAKAILQALKTYGMYIADGGSDMYITGSPSAMWQDDTFAQVQAVAASEFEAVDITAITSRDGWSADSAAVP